MLQLFSSLSDNQTAILGCVAALGGAMSLLAMSYYAGQGKPASTKVLKQPQVAQHGASSDQRKAA